MSTVGHRLRAERGKAGLSQAELSEKSQIAVRTITAIETGEVERPNAWTVAALAKALGLTYETLIGT